MGAEFEGGIPDLVPGYGFAAVGGLAAHDAGEGGFGDTAGFIDGVALADAIDEVDVFLFVGVGVGVAEAPGSAFGWLDPIAAVTGAFGAEDGFFDFVVAVIDLAALAEHADAVGVFEFDGEVVVDMAIDGGGTGLAPAEAGGADGVGLEDPVDDIEVMDVLFDDVITAEPGEVVPVAELPFDIGPAGFTVDDPDFATVPVGAGFDDIADGAVLEAFDGFEVTGLVSALGTGGDAEAFLFGEFTGFDHEACALGVDGGGFFDEDVLACLDGGHELGGAEVGRGGEDDVIDVGEGEELVGGIPAGEAVVFAYDDGVGEVFEVFAAGGEAVGEEVGEGDDLDIFASG